MAERLATRRLTAVAIKIGHEMVVESRKDREERKGRKGVNIASNSSVAATRARLCFGSSLCLLRAVSLPADLEERRGEKRREERRGERRGEKRGEERREERE